MDYICYRRKLGEVEVRKFIRQIVSAVYYLHQGGILHRDLKVENLLLDDDYNIKIIDFGLSNTLFVSSPDGQNAKEFLKTQCGSPAYAAPEILGHKPYGPEVDVWSIGVNMYAMLTGKLPYSAEPFHITTLYNKMKRNDMNPIPDHLSSSCKDLIQRLLTFNRESRITLDEVLNHEWLQKGFDGPVIPIAFPNYLQPEELDKNIIRHMVNKMEFKQQETVDAVAQNRSTATSTVYHLLQRKLKRYYVKHPGKADHTINDVAFNSEPIRNSPTVTPELENKNSSKKRREFAVTAVNACDFNDKMQTTPNETTLESEKLAVPREGREQLSSPSQENLSLLDEELAENPNSSHQGDPISEKSINGIDDDNSSEKKDRTCSVLSDDRIEISRKDSCNYSSVEIMAVNGRRLSHTSGESKDLEDKNEPEVKETTVNNHENSSRRISETKFVAPQEKNSPRLSTPNTPSIGKVSPINAKIISIPLQSMKMEFPDKVKFNHRRFSLPQTFLPPKNLGNSQQRQHVPSPFHFNSTSSSTDSKQRNRDSPSLPPYGLCCQLTAIKPQEEKEDSVTRAHEARSRSDHVQHSGIENRHAQPRRNVYYSPTTERRFSSKRHSVATSGGRELLKSINNTLGRLVEIQDNTESSKSPDSLLLRSRLLPATINAPLKHDSSVGGVKISLIQEHAGVERVKEKRSSGLKISCSVKDTQTAKPPPLSNPTGPSTTESKSAKEQITREKKTKAGLLNRGATGRRRRTLENKIPIEIDSASSPKDGDGTPLNRRSRDVDQSAAHDAVQSGRRSLDSLEEII